jgi:hypothetical protein
MNSSKRWRKRVSRCCCWLVIGDLCVSSSHRFFATERQQLEQRQGVTAHLNKTFSEWISKINQLYGHPQGEDETVQPGVGGAPPPKSASINSSAIPGADGMSMRQTNASNKKTNALWVHLKAFWGVAFHKRPSAHTESGMTGCVDGGTESPILPDASNGTESPILPAAANETESPIHPAAANGTESAVLPASSNGAEFTI